MRACMHFRDSLGTRLSHGHKDTYVCCNEVIHRNTTRLHGKRGSCSKCAAGSGGKGWYGYANYDQDEHKTAEECLGGPLPSCVIGTEKEKGIKVKFWLKAQVASSRPPPEHAPPIVEAAGPPVMTSPDRV